MRRRRWLLVLLELLLVAAVIYSIHAWRTGGMLGADEAVTAPPFSLARVDGGRLDLAQLRGRPTVLYFFAPWCQVCRASAHQLGWFEDLLGDRVNLVLIGLDYDSRTELTAFRRRHELAAPVLAGNPAVAAAYRVLGYPSYYVVDARGRITGRAFGATTLPGLALRAWLAADPGETGPAPGT